MADTTDSQGTAIYPSAGKACETCKMPDMSNMTWDDGAKWFTSTFFATPRMWPVGYILNDPYSPLRLELDSESPNINWRDAFEDLLALQSGYQMVSEASRKAEDAFAARRRFEHTSWFISLTNLHLQSLHTIVEAVKARQKKPDHDVERTQLMLAAAADDQKILVVSAQNSQADFERLRDSTASSQKPRGQWIASLIHSGALPEWSWAMWNSLNGPVMMFERHDPSPELQAEISISEWEIQQTFENGRPWGFKSTDPIPLRQVTAMINAENGPPWESVPGHPFENFKPSGSSLMAQACVVSSVKLPDGSLGTKVSIKRVTVDGKSEEKAYFQDAGKLLEDIENGRTSMSFVCDSLFSKSHNVPLSWLQQMAQEIKEQDEGESLAA
ncbi:MAG: hypothetical protein Q9194_005499 [Teloschistes cf. exilis]